MNDPVIVVDWGGYDQEVPIEELAQNGIAGFISQIGGAGTAKLLARTRNAGMLTGLYGWENALVPVQSQVDYFSRAIEKENPDIIEIDHEHMWKWWYQYNEYLAGKRKWEYVEKLAPNLIANHGAAVMEGIKKRWAGKYILGYSAKWVTSGYSPNSVAFLKRQPFNVASYADYGNKTYTLPWEQIKQGMYIHATKGLKSIVGYRPALPDGMTEWDMCQYSSRIMPPGLRYPLDWNVFNGTREQLLAKCGKTAPVTPPVEPPAPVAHTVTVTANFLTVKAAPGSGKVLRYVRMGDVLEVGELVNGYYPLVNGGWVNSKWVK